MGHTDGVWVARPVVVGGRVRVLLVALVALVAFACATPGGASAAGGVKKCRQFTLVRIKHGRRVHVRVTKCVVVRSKVCTVTWSKEKRHGKVVIRQGNPVWVAKVTCPTTGPSTAAQAEALKVLALPQKQPIDINLFASQYLFEGVPLNLQRRVSIRPVPRWPPRQDQR